MNNNIISNIDNKHVTTVKIDDGIVSNKEVVGTFIKNTGEIEIININHVYDDLKGQYINIQSFGTWYIDDLKSDEEFITSKLTLYDITHKFDEDYEDSFSFPDTMKNWATWIGNKVGVPLKGDFLNGDLILTERPYLGNKPKYRDAVKLISKYACSYAQKNYDNTYSIKWFDEERTDIQDWESFVHGNQTEPLNVIVLSTGNTEDNVKFPETDPQKPHELRIEDDWINIDRYSINEAIYNQVNGFFYTPISKLNIPYGLLNFRAGQKIKTQDIEHQDIETYISKVSLEWQGGDFDDPNAWTTSVQMEELKETSTKLSYANSFENRVLSVERKADKNAGEITDTIKKVDEQREQLVQMGMTVEGITMSVETIETNAITNQQQLNELQQSINMIQKTVLEQTSESFTMWFEQTGLQNTLNAIQNELNSNTENINTLTEYIRFKGAEIELGKSSSQTRLVIKNDRISFMTGDTESAYISENTLYITDSTILNKLRIGHWEEREDQHHNLNTRWIGGTD